MKEQRNLTKTLKPVIRCVLSVAVAFTIFGFMYIQGEAATGTVKSSNVNVRSEASAGSTAVATVTTNDTITIDSQTTGADGLVWYKIVTSGGVTGYIRSDFVTKNAEPVTSTTTVTPTDSKTAYVAGNGSVRIRKDASTNSDLVASANGGTQLTVTGEATAADGYKWYQIKFTGNGKEMTGFIRSDLVTFTAPVQEPETSEIVGTMGEETPVEDPVPEEVPSEDPATEPQGEPAIPASSASASELNILQPISSPEVIPTGFEEVTLDLGDREVTAWYRGDFYILYASKADGSQGWFLYDYQNRSYLRCEGLFDTGVDTVTEPKAEGLNFKLITIILAVVLVIAIAVIVVLGYKLANIEYDDDYEDYEDEEEEPAPAPVRSRERERERAVVSATRETKPVKSKPERKSSPEKRTSDKKRSVGRKFIDYFTEEVDDEDYIDEEDDTREQKEDIDYIDF